MKYHLLYKLMTTEIFWEVQGASFLALMQCAQRKRTYCKGLS